jgi:hypothetical protein
VPPGSRGRPSVLAPFGAVSEVEAQKIVRNPRSGTLSGRRLAGLGGVSSGTLYNDAQGRLERAAAPRLPHYMPSTRRVNGAGWASA